MENSGGTLFGYNRDLKNGIPENGILQIRQSSQIGLTNIVKVVKFLKNKETFGEETSSIEARPLAG